MFVDMLVSCSEHFQVIVRSFPTNFADLFDNIQEEQTKLQLKDYITSLTDYMLDIGMNITPLPEVIVKKDAINASNFFGKTAYYSPSDMTIVLYTEGRHPKDVVRSFAHEMIHHIQNLEGRLGDINTTNTNC